MTDDDAIVYALGVKDGGPDVASGLYDTLTGDQIVLNKVGNDIVGSVGALEVFRITVHTNGNVSLDQSRAVVHSADSGPDQSIALAADLVTLTDDLERRGQLPDIGGPAFLTGLINATPTSIHVEFYARIVERTAILRRLIDAAGQIARLAYQDVDDVDEVVDRAESIIFGVSERRVARDLVPIRQVQVFILSP